MSAKLDSNFEQIGWKVWYHNGTAMSIYNSIDHTWEDLPAQGVQFMKRFYLDKVEGFKFGELITAKDLYTERRDNLNSLVLADSRLKEGSTKTHAELRDSLAAKRLQSSFRGLIDNSIEKYTDSKRRMSGWECYYEDGALYSSALGHSWESLPPTGVILLLRGFKSGNYEWVEHTYNSDLYVLDKSMEVEVVQSNSAVKRGLLIDSTDLDAVSAAVKVDKEIVG